MKCSNPPFSIDSRSICNFCINGVISILPSVLIVNLPALSTTAYSWSSRYTTFLVYSIIGEASDATKNSWSPIPNTSGLPLRATIRLSSLVRSITTIAYAPTTSFRAMRTASSSDTSSCFLISSIRFTSTSVSVSDLKVYPLLVSCSFKAA
ncbi:hypothetical protein D9M68_863800 [compost metagenome]